MGASWLEIDKLIREVETLAQFPHAEVLPPVTRARDVVAETAMVVSLAGISDQRQAESEAQDLMARARVAVLDAQIAVTRAMEAVAQCHAGRARAQAMVAEARALRARDRSRASLAVGRAAAPDEASPPLIRVSERASAS
jgi:hypothetical protein